MDGDDLTASGELIASDAQPRLQLADQLDAQERLWEFDQRLKVGARRTLGAGFAIDCSAAYLVDWSYFRSDSFFSSDVERLRVDPGAQFMLTLEWER